MQKIDPPPKPALSEQSTSNPPIHPGPRFPPSATTSPAAYVSTSDTKKGSGDNEEEDEDEDEEDEVDIDQSDALLNGSLPSPGIQNPSFLAQCQRPPSELMQLDMSEDIRIGSPEDGSNNLESDHHFLSATSQIAYHGGTMRLRQGEDSCRWQLLEEDSRITDIIQLPFSSSGVPEFDELAEEDTHYSQTVSAILEHQSRRCSDASSRTTYILRSPLTAFSTWSSAAPTHDRLISSSQRLLKHLLFTLPLVLHSYKVGADQTPPSPLERSISDTASRLRKGGGPQQEDQGANHVLAERRRREKLNERFIILRSLVPFVTKMDKASILGDTIEYVKQLCKRIQELEARDHQVKEQGGGRVRASTRLLDQSVIKKKMKIDGGKSLEAEEEVEVSIIESDALVELKCLHREGLLLDVMQMLRELGVEIIAVQSSLINGVFMAELRAKVKDNPPGKKATIIEVKKAIHQIISQC